jgi:hypothetical protein
MELMEWATIVVICGLLSGIFGAVFAYATVWLRDYRVARLEKEVERLTMCDNSTKGNAARAQKAERMQAAMLEVGAIMNDAAVTDKQAAIMKLAMKYPDLALDLVKKGL